MNNLYTKDFVVKGKTLRLLALDNEGVNYDFRELAKVVEGEFAEIGPLLKKPVQILYIRDNHDLSIGGKYPGGNTYFPTETMIALPSWKDVSNQELVAVVAHELHHMARWQNAGYGNTLGGALTSEGIATYYEELRSGRKPLWAEVEIPAAAWTAARNEWQSSNYNHFEWFFNGPYGKWVGYALGYKIAKRKLADFDLKMSVTVEDKDLLGDLE